VEEEQVRVRELRKVGVGGLGPHRLVLVKGGVQCGRTLNGWRKEV